MICVTYYMLYYDRYYVYSIGLHIWIYIHIYIPICIYLWRTQTNTPCLDHPSPPRFQLTCSAAITPAPH